MLMLARGCQMLPEAVRGWSDPPRLIEAALHESATHSATLIDKLWHLWHTFLFCHERHTFVAPIHLISLAGIHVGPCTGPALNYYFP